MRLSIVQTKREHHLVALLCRTLFPRRISPSMTAPHAHECRLSGSFGRTNAWHFTGKRNVDSGTASEPYGVSRLLSCVRSALHLHINIRVRGFGLCGCLRMLHSVYVSWFDVLVSFQLLPYLLLCMSENACFIKPLKHAHFGAQCHCALRDQERSTPHPRFPACCSATFPDHATRVVHYIIAVHESAGTRLLEECQKIKADPVLGIRPFPPALLH